MTLLETAGLLRARRASTRSFVLARLQNRGETGAFFAKLGFKPRSTPNTVVPSTVGFLDILAADASSPYADSDYDSDAAAAKERKPAGCASRGPVGRRPDSHCS